MAEKEQLLHAPNTDAPAAPAPSEHGAILKYGSLGLVIVQNSSHVLLLRYSRVMPGEGREYVTSVAVLFAELLKLTFCLVVLLLFVEQGPCAMFGRLKVDIWDRKLDTLKVAIPALCYTVQNNLQFVAASHLGAALLQLLYQTKTLTTAVFGVVILRKTLRCNQWCALSVLVAGVVLAQGSQRTPGAQTSSGDLVGICAAIGVSVCSGFASVYLEKILKGDKTSLWVRNVQLCIFSIPLQGLAIYQRDYDKVVEKGFLHGFCLTTWLVVCMFAFGGLLVAVVIRFADNNLKNLAMAVAILVSCLASVPLFDFKPNEIFAAGAALVIASIFLYAWQPKPATPYLPVAATEMPSK